MAVTSKLLGLHVSDDVPDRELNEDQMIARCVDTVNDWFSYFNNNIQQARDDIYFAMMQQWEQDLYNERVQMGKACLEVNYIYSIIASLIGQFRKQTPEFKVFAAADETNPKVKVDQNMIDLVDSILRQISFDNKTEIVFQQAFESALLRGFGAICIDVDYESDFSFNQVPKIKAIDDPLMCYFDPSARTPTKHDSRYCGYLITYTIAEFKDKYPDSKYVKNGMIPGSFPTNDLNGQAENYWRSEEYIRVACDYRKESYPVKIALLSDGRSLKYDDAVEEVNKARSLVNRVKRKENKLRDAMQSLGFGVNKNSFFDDYEPLTIVDTRETIDYKIINRIMTDQEILEETEWPSKIMPIIFVDGHSQMIDGKQYTKSFHRTAKDAQRILNYSVSESIENLMNSHKEQWIGTPENFAGYENIWRNPSLSSGALIANRDDTGNLPQQVAPPQISPNFAQIMQQSINDIKSTLGYFEANRGEQGNEKSGVAIANRATQGALSSFVYFDNIANAIDQTYKCVLSLIPVLYDNTRTILVRDKSGEQKSVMINKPNGDDYDNDLTVGKYGIEVTVGSNFELQKQENLSALKDLIATLAPSNPTLVGALADLYAANTDLENTTQIVERIREIQLGKSPQEILRLEMDLPPEPPKPNPQAQAMQAEQQAKMAEIQIKQKQMELDYQKSLQDIELKKYDLSVKEKQLALEEKRLLAEFQSNNIEKYKADKSLEEIKLTTATERYNSDKDVEVERIKAHQSMHKNALDAHKSSADIHVAHLNNQGMQESRASE